MTNARKALIGAIVVGYCSIGARAEVSAETDFFGNYLRTVVSSNTSIRALRIWSVGRVRPTHWPLNPVGDANGDLWPYVAENPVQGRWPWVAWSQFNGADYDLAWARWSGSGWSRVATVEQEPGADDELDPVIAFDTVGRPHMVWVMRDPSGSSRVVFSFFLATRWLEPFQVSEPFEDALNPTVVIRADGSVDVDYDTDEGHVTRTIRLWRPRTITDDITPFNAITVTDTRRSTTLRP